MRLQGFHTKKILNGILLFLITSLIIHNYKYIYYKSIYNFCNFAPSLIKNDYGYTLYLWKTR